MICDIDFSDLFIITLLLLNLILLLGVSKIIAPCFFLNVILFSNKYLISINSISSLGSNSNISFASSYVNWYFGFIIASVI